MVTGLCAFATRDARAATCATGANVTLSSPCEWPSSTTTYQYTGTLTISTTITAGTLDSSTPVTVSADNITMTGSATITLNGRGPAFNTGGGTVSGSAGHGGMAGTETGAVYDSVYQPVLVGSSTSNVRGGGALRIVASGTVNLNGTSTLIDVSGGGGAAGGGSGGSVYITTTTFGGTGIIAARGGTSSGTGKGGGGGRIAVEYSALVGGSTITTTAGRLSVYGGTAAANNHGGAGTVLLKGPGATYGTLVVDNESFDGAYTRLDPAITSFDFDQIVVRNVGRLRLTPGQSAKSWSAIPNGVNGQARILVDSGANLTLPSAALTITGWDLIMNGTVTGPTSATLTSTTVLYNTGSFVPGLASLTVGNSATFEKWLLDPLTIPTITVQSGGTIQHAANSSSLVHNLYLEATNLDVQSGGKLTAVNKGYDLQLGTGWSNGGAAHGGLAGSDKGVVHDFVEQPTEMGAGGTAVKGGGVIHLEVSGVLTVNGQILADGTAGGTCPNAGSAGGAIWIETNQILGTGTISAAGGIGGCLSAIGAGGGRIAVHYQTFVSGTVIDPTAAKTLAIGGDTGQTSTGGGAGTVYLNRIGVAKTLVVDQNNAVRGNTPLVPTSSETYDNVIVRGGARLVVPSGTTLTVLSTLTGAGTRGSLTVNSGGNLYGPTALTINGVDVNHAGHFYGTTNLTLTNTTWLWDAGTFDAGLVNLVVNSAGIFEQRFTNPLSVTQLDVNSGGTYRSADNTTTTLTHQVYVVATTVNVTTGGSINTNGRGYPLSSGSGFFNGAAGHGGLGGNERGKTTDSVENPTEMGAGGTASKGGGVIYIDAPTINATGTARIESSGINAAVSGSGGAGGSVWLFTQTLAGDGVIAANGALGAGTSYSGGGGRVAIQYRTKTGFIGGALATSPVNGSVSVAGGAGTVLFNQMITPFLHDLVIDNAGNAASGTPQNVDTQAYDSVVVRGGAKYVIPTGATLNAFGLTGGATLRGSVVIQGGTLRLDNTSYAINNLDIVQAGAIDSAADLTLTTMALYLQSGATYPRPTNINVSTSGTIEQQFVGPVTGIGNLNVSSGVLRHADNTTSTKQYSVDISAVNITITNAATVNVSGRGFPAGTGPGASGSAAGHGGLSGNNGGACYGSVDQPVTLGSGGSGKGGGAIKLTASDTFTLTGVINADGNIGGSCTNGSAGGSVWITANTLAGTGSITAKGGNGSSCSNISGGGGRIAIYYANNNGSLLNGSNLLANSLSGSSNATGGAGTVYIQKTSAPISKSLIVDNFTTSAAYTSQVGTSETYDNVTFRGASVYRVNSGQTLTATSSISGGATTRATVNVFPGGTLVAPSTTLALTDLDMVIGGALQTVTDLSLTRAGFYLAGTVPQPMNSLSIGTSGTFEQQKVGAIDIATVDVTSTGVLRSGNNTTTTKTAELNINATNITIASTALVDASSMGYPANTGPGYAANGSAHGGYSGIGSGTTYGNLEAPVDMGSSGNGTKGGGVIKLVASGTLTNNGTITAESWDSNSCTNAGAGGSVWIVANAIAGTGAITVKGGRGSSCSNVGGGGGRMAIHYNAASGTVLNNLVAASTTGSSQTPGGAGTIFLNKTSAPLSRTLIIDNNGVAGRDTPQLGTSESYDTLIVRGGAFYDIGSGKTTTVTTAITGSSTSRGTLQILAGGTLNTPSTNLPVTDLDVNVIGTLQTVTDLTLLRSNFYLTGSITQPMSSLTIGNGGVFEQRKVGALDIATVDVQAGGTLRSGNNTTTTKTIELNINATNISIASTALVDASSMGYPANSGPGYFSNGSGHGGYSGIGSGTTYGNLEAPVDMGSSGNGTKGGGVIKLVASGTLTNNGTITAESWDSNSCTNAGAGGSIWIITNALAGTGAITVKGGRGSSCSNVGGGGGRMAIHYNSASGTVLNNLVASSTSGSSSTAGGAGTIFLNKTSAPTSRTLIIDNNGVVSRATPQLATSESYDTLIVRGGAIYDIGSGKTTSITTAITGSSTSRGTLQILAGGTLNTPSTNLPVTDLDVNVSGTLQTVTDLTLTRSNFYLTGSITQPMNSLTIATGGVFEQRKVGALDIANVDIQANGTLRSGNNTTTTKTNEVNVNATNITIASTALVDAGSMGYPANTGPGYLNNGSAHGGLSGTGGGTTYGSVEAPVDMGSTGNGTKGGGVIKLVASGTFTNNGTITAESWDSNTCTNAGAGGSVWIVTNALAGTGTVSVKGGRGSSCSNVGGGGGRMAIHYASVSGTILNNLIAASTTGSSQTSGGAGTIFLNKTSAPTSRTLIVDNNGVSGQRTPQIATNESYDTLIVRGNAFYDITSGKTTSVTTALTGSSTSRGTLIVSSGGTLNAPSPALTVTDLNVTLAGTLQVATDITLLRSTFVFSGTIAAGLASLVIQTGSVFEQQKVGAINLTTLDVQSGGTLQSGDNPGGTKLYEVNFAASDITVSGTVTTSLRGNPANTGPGLANGGAAYGGLAGGDRGTIYGSVEAPVDLGTGGGGKSGGAIKLAATNSLTINGQIAADGQNGPGCSSGSSGGSIWLVTNALAGTGTVIARGGFGANCSTLGGGGGRIAVHYASATGTLLNGASISAQAINGTGAQTGGAGSVFINKTSAPTSRTLIIDNFGNAAGTTPQLATSESYTDLAVRNNAVYNITSGKTTTVTGTLTGATIRGTLTIGGTFVAPGASLPITDLNVNLGGTLQGATDITLTRATMTDGGTYVPGLASLVIGNTGVYEQWKLGPVNLTTLDVQANGTLQSAANISGTKLYQVSFAAANITVAGTVTASGRGAPNGTGAGFASSGAGYGGLAGASRGALYGSVTQPVDIGSGSGGAGGGAIKLVASNTLTVNGTISADGVNGGGCTNGGSGGSVWLVTNNLAGSGSLSARGAAGTNCSTVSGGGGRIAVHYQAATGTLLDAGKAIAASPSATGTSVGAPGTVLYRKLGSPDKDTLVYDNAGVSTGVNARITASSESYTNLTMRSGAILQLVNGQRLDLASDGLLTGHPGGSPRPSIVIDSGAIMKMPTTTSIEALDVTDNGKIEQLRSLTIKSSAFTYNPQIATVFGALTLDSSSTFTKSGLPRIVIEGPLVVKSGGTLTHTANGGSQTHVLDVKAISVDVQSGGAINANALGYVSGNGPGAGGSGVPAGGGGHGGAGGRGGGATTGGGGEAGGVAYGDAVALLGSAGGDDTGLNNQQGGSGGGSIALQVCGDLTVNGSITANGQAALGRFGGGGAGGTVMFTVAAFKGTGTITANGGDGGWVNNTSGGGGGGGRVSPQYQTKTFSGTMTANGGARTPQTPTVSQPGVSFTIDPVVTAGGDLCPEYACAGGTCGASWDPNLGACSYAISNGVACNDNNLCTTGETCTTGVCGTGAAVNCDDGIVCTTDSCSPTLGCQHPNAPSSQSCNDNNPCTVNDHCSVGACVSGGATNCNDNDACTTDSCQPATGCQHVDVVCNALDQCHDAGTCNPLNGLCSNPNKPNGTTCDDNSVCTTGDACAAGACTGLGINCDDGNACSLDSCNATTGCINTPHYPTIVPDVPAQALLDDASASVDLDNYDRDCFGNSESSGLVWDVSGGDTSLLTYTLDAGNVLELVPVETSSTWSLTLTLYLSDSLGGIDTQPLVVTHSATPFVLALSSDPGTLVADGSATAAVQATLTSPAGLSVASRKVTFSTQSGPGRVVTATAYTDSSGVATTEVLAGTTDTTSVIRGTVVTNQGTYAGTTPIAATLPGPDLALTPDDITFHDPDNGVEVHPGAIDPTDPGATLEVRARVHNLGGSATPAGLRLDFHDAVVANGALGNAHVVASATLPAIAAYGETLVTLDITFPEAGFHTLTAIADAGDELDEGHEDDNRAAEGFWIGTPPDGDVITTICQLDKTQIRSGGHLAIWGRADYTPFLPFDPDHARGISAVKGGIVSLALRNAQNQPVSISGWLPVTGDNSTNRALHTIGQWPDKVAIGRFTNRSADDRWGFPGPAALGSYFVRACVSDGSFTGCCEAPFQVVPNGADVACSGANLPNSGGETPPAVGVATSISSTISNHGDVAANNVKVRFYVDGQVSGEQTLSLGPNASQLVTFPWTPACEDATVQILVDPDQALVEAEEADNRCTRGTPDLRLSSVDVSNVHACQLNLGITTASNGQMPIGPWSSTMIATRPDGSTVAAGASFDTSSQPGIWRFDATVDTPIALPGLCGGVPESSELANNVGVAVVCPDPSPWRDRDGPNSDGAVDIIAAPLPVRYGESTTVTARITNWGSLTFQEDLSVSLASAGNVQTQTIDNSCADGIEPGGHKDVQWTWTPVYAAGNEPRVLNVTTGAAASCRTNDRATTKILSLDLRPDLALAGPRYGVVDNVSAHIIHEGSIAPNGEGSNARLAFVRKDGSEIEGVTQAIVRPIAGSPETFPWAWTPTTCAADDDTMDGVRVITDVNSVYAEANETNNVALIHLPDLEPTSVSQIADGCGTRFSFSVTDKAPSPSMGIGQWSARLVLVRPDGVELAPMDGGPYSGIGTFQIGGQVDTSMSGTWTARIIVDTGTASAGCGDIPEYRESNNTFVTNLSLCPDPSPQVTGIAIAADHDAQFDHPVTLTATIRNSGSTAIAHPVALKLTTDTVDPETDALNDTVTLPVDCSAPLLPGQSRDVSIIWTPRLANRPHRLTVTTDPSDVFPGECNETNNVASRDLWLDLSPWRDERGMNYQGATDIDATPATAIWGGPNVLGYGIFNRPPQGDSYRLMLVPNGGAGTTITNVRRREGGLVAVDTTAILAPSPSAPQSVTATWTSLAGLCNPDDGLEQIEVDVDPENYFPEDREDNNHTTRAFPDLVLGGPSLSDVHQSKTDVTFGSSNAAPAPMLGIGSWSARATITRPDLSDTVVGPLALSGTGTKLLVDDLVLNQNGHWKIVVQGDVNGACGEIPEQDEQNNDTTAEFDICPDVSVELFNAPPLTLNVPVPITVRFTNGGNSTLVEDVQVVLESNPPGTPLTLVGSPTRTLSFAPGAGLDPGESVDVTYTWTPTDVSAVSGLRATATVLDTQPDNGAVGVRECAFGNNSDAIPIEVPYGCRAGIALPGWQACNDGHWTVSLTRPSGALVPANQIVSVSAHFEDTTGLIDETVDLRTLGNAPWAGIIDLPPTTTHAGVAAFVTAELADGSTCGASVTTTVQPGPVDLNLFSDDIDFVSKNGNEAFFNQADPGDTVIVGLQLRNGPNACLATDVNGSLVVNLGYDQIEVGSYHFDQIAAGETKPIDIVPSVLGDNLTAIGNGRFQWTIEEPSPWLHVLEVSIVNSDNVDASVADNTASRALMVGRLGQGDGECNCELQGPLESFPAGEEETVRFRLTSTITTNPVEPTQLARLAMFLTIDDASAVEPVDLLETADYEGNGVYSAPVILPPEQSGSTVQVAVLAALDEGGTCDTVAARAVEDPCNCDDGNTCTTDGCDEDGACVHETLPATEIGDATCDGIDDDCDGAFDEDYAPMPAACTETDVCSAATGVTRCDEGTVVVDCDTMWLDIADHDDQTCEALAPVVYAVVNDNYGVATGTIRCRRAPDGKPSCDTESDGETLKVYDGLICPQ